MEDDNYMDMHRVTSEVASFRGIYIANRFLILFLAAVQIYFIVTRDGAVNFSPLYILIMGLLLPLIIESLLRNRSPKQSEEEKSWPLPNFRKKFHFTMQRKKAHSYAFLMNVLMIFLWRTSYLFGVHRFTIYETIPVIVLASYFLIRVLIWLYYLILFKFNPTVIMKYNSRNLP